MKIKNKDRFIKRMIIALGTAVTVASVGATAYGFVEATNVRNYYKDNLDVLNEQKVELQNDKTTYLEEFENSTTFKDTYNAYVEDINNRLIAREISGVEYDNQLTYLNSNQYVEDALLSSSEPVKTEVEQINTEISEVNNQINTLTNERENKADNLSLGIGLSCTFIGVAPLATYLIHELYDIHSRFKKEEENAKINYYYDSTTGTIIPLSPHLKKVKNKNIPNKTRHVDACIINTEEDEQNKGL